MIHLVIHFPLEALEGGPIRPRWMFPFERYMKKLKGYVRNKAKPEGSIAEGYVVEEALTFSSHYFRDVTTKFNRPNHNVDPPPPTLFPNKDMKEEFPEWFGSQIRQNIRIQDQRPSLHTSELFRFGLLDQTGLQSQTSCVVAVRCSVVQVAMNCHTLNSGICSPGPDGEMYYGQLKEILEFTTIDLIHFVNLSDLPLSTSLNDLDNATLHIDGQSMEMSDDEDHNNVADDDGKGKRKLNLGGRVAGRLNTHDKTRNLSLKEITDKKGPVPIRFELRDKQTLMPLGDHAAHWSSYIGEVIRGVPLYYPSWLKVPKERKAALITNIGTQFDLRPHMESPDWTEINAGIQQHLQKAYNTNKAAFKAQLSRNIARAAQNQQNRAKSTVISRQGSRSLARLRDEMRQSSGTQEYPSLIDTFFVAHTVNGEFLQDEDHVIYEEMRRLEATGTYTDDEINRLARRGKQRGHIPGVGRVLPARATAGPSTPASESTLNSLHKKVDFMMSLFKSDSKYSDMFSQFESGGASGSGGCGDDEESADDQEDEDEDGDGDS
ncbi:F-box domain containing protein [Tanacetum coccineum]